MHLLGRSVPERFGGENTYKIVAERREENEKDEEKKILRKEKEGWRDFGEIVPLCAGQLQGRSGLYPGLMRSERGGVAGVARCQNTEEAAAACVCAAAISAWVRVCVAIITCVRLCAKMLRACAPVINFHIRVVALEILHE